MWNYDATYSNSYVYEKGLHIRASKNPASAQISGTASFQGANDGKLEIGSSRKLKLGLLTNSGHLLYAKLKGYYI